MAGRYYYLIRTDEGHDRKSPCGTFCWEPDVARWVQATQYLAERVNQAWAKLEKNAPEVAQTYDIAAWNQEIANLPSWWDIYVEGYGTPTQARNVVDGIIATMETGADMLEEIQDELGDESIYLPKSPSPQQNDFWDSFAALVIGSAATVGLGALIWYGVKNKRTRLVAGGED